MLQCNTKLSPPSCSANACYCVYKGAARTSRSVIHMPAQALQKQGTVCSTGSTSFLKAAAGSFANHASLMHLA